MNNKPCINCQKPMNGGMYRYPNKCPHCFTVQDEALDGRGQMLSEQVETDAVSQQHNEYVVEELAPEVAQETYQASAENEQADDFFSIADESEEVYAEDDFADPFADPFAEEQVEETAEQPQAQIVEAVESVESHDLDQQDYIEFEQSEAAKEPEIGSLEVEEDEAFYEEPVQEEQMEAQAVGQDFVAAPQEQPAPLSVQELTDALAAGKRPEQLNTQVVESRAQPERTAEPAPVAAPQPVAKAAPKARVQPKKSNIISAPTNSDKTVIRSISDAPKVEPKASVKPAPKAPAPTQKAPAKVTPPVTRQPTPQAPAVKKQVEVPSAVVEQKRSRAPVKKEVKPSVVEEFASTSLMDVPKKQEPARKFETNNHKTIVLTTETAHDLEVKEWVDIITAESLFDMSVIKNVASSENDISGGASQYALKGARKAVLYELRKEAFLLGANAVVGVSLDYREITTGDKNMLLVVASGTAVKAVL